MKIPQLTKVNNADILDSVANLPRYGKLNFSKNHLLYLDVDNDYIHKTYPLILTPPVQKPDYFSEDAVGAHISVIYPEEEVTLAPEELNQVHHFIITDSVTAKLDNRIYYIFLIEAPSLLELRQKYGLTAKLPFKGYAIDFHITFGKQLT